ncbi:hypothetical protein D6817_03230 [Candidatus Pacearchaeota archaeon]|nr:MAG: hypothetical protein D6817_03230 [Candidatus Pacearchaeota archaeon]
MNNEVYIPREQVDGALAPRSQVRIHAHPVELILRAGLDYTAHFYRGDGLEREIESYELRVLRSCCNKRGRAFYVVLRARVEQPAGTRRQDN